MQIRIFVLSLLIKEQVEAAWVKNHYVPFEILMDHLRVGKILSFIRILELRRLLMKRLKCP